MANVFPRVRPSPSERVSEAELEVLGELSGLPSDWIVLHSLWLKTHSFKLNAEADFVVITDKAVLILEVKGGLVWRAEDGTWHFRTKSGRDGGTKREGPLEQARGAYYAIAEHLRAIGRESLFDNYAWGYGAILPECVLKFTKADSAHDQRMVLDERGWPGTLHPFLASLSAYWSERLRGELYHTRRDRDGPRESITPATRTEIAACLRPRLDVGTSLAGLIAGSEHQILRLTDQQLLALDHAEGEPRNLLLGAAGTGKTVLALEQARRRATGGAKILYVCFNSFLARTVAADIRRRRQPNVVAMNYHHLAIDLVRKSGGRIEFADDWEDFSAALQESLEALVSNIDDRERYDYLVVDEAQDLMSDPFLDLLDCLLKGGLKGGSWLFALDTDQILFRENFDAAALKRVGDFGRRLPLPLNCRNTKPIAAYVRAISGAGSVSVRSAEGENPVVRYYESRPDYLRILKRVVNELVASLADIGRPASHVTVLTADRNFLPPQILEPGFFLRTARFFDPEDGEADVIRLATIQSFKGLECAAIVLVGLERFDSPTYRDLFYVGASRAHAALRILLPANCDHIEKSLPEITRLLG